MCRFMLVVGLMLMVSSASAQYRGGQQSVRSTPNVFGGANYSNGVSTRSNVFGGQTAYQGGSQIGSSTRNVFGGQNYSSGVQSKPNVFGGQNYSNGVSSRANVFGGQDFYRGSTRIGSSSKTSLGTEYRPFGR